MATQETELAPYPREGLAVGRNPWITALAAAPFLVCVLAIVGSIVISPGLLILMIHGLGFGVAASWYAWGRNPWPRLTPTDIRIDGPSLVIGTHRHARADLKAGFIVPGDGHVTVQLKRRGLRRDLEIRMGDEAEGRALLQALGLAATQTVASFRTMSRAFVSIWRVLAAVVGGMAGGTALMSILGQAFGPVAGTVALVSLIAILAVVLVAPARVEVGADGVLIRWLGRERFFAHDDIRSLRTTTRGMGNNRRKLVELELSSGETYVIPTGSAAFDFGRARSLEARIVAAQQAWAGGESVHAEALLRRGARTHQQWVDALQHPHTQSTHRQAPVAPKRLWRIVEDPKSESLDRAAAAIALTPELDAQGRARLARSAAATAAPRLRIALDAVAQNESDEALAEALTELEEEQAKRQALP